MEGFYSPVDSLLLEKDIQNRENETARAQSKARLAEEDARESKEFIEDWNNNFHGLDEDSSAAFRRNYRAAATLSKANWARDKEIDTKDRNDKKNSESRKTLDERSKKKHQGIFDTIRIIDIPDDYDYEEGLTAKERKRLAEAMEAVGITPPKKDGILTEFGQGFAGAALDVGRGFGSTIEETTGYSGMREYFDEVKARNRQYDPYPGYKAASLDPVNIARTVGSGVAQSSLSLGAGLVTTAATGGNAAAGAYVMGSIMFGQLYGDRIKEYREAMPEQDDFTVRQLAFYSAAGESLIEVALGPEAIFNGIAKRWVTGALKETTKGLVKKVGKEAAIGFLTEGSEEVFQDLWNRICLRAGTENVTLPSWEEVKEEFMGGAWSGLFMGGAGGVVENLGAGKAGSRSTDVSAGGEVAGRDAAGEPVSDGGMQEFNEWFRRKQKEMRAGSRNTGDTENTVVDAGSEAASPEEMSAASRVTEEVAKEIGLKVRFLDEEGAPAAVDDNGNAVNGWYDEKKDEFWIDRKDPEMSPLKTLGHEFKHYLNKRHPELAKAFDELVDKGMNEKGVQALGEVEDEYQNGGYAPGQGNVEFSADTMGEVWADPDFWRDFIEKAEKQERGLGQKMLEALQAFIKIIRAKLKGIGTPEAKEMFDNFGALKDEASRILLEVKRRNGTSTEAENVVGVKGSDTVQSIPLSELGIDPARFQFKSKADKETGVDESNQIGGEWDPKTAGNLYVWEDKDGKKFVVNGHHRYQLAKEKGVEKVNAIVDREADGVTAEQARRNGVLINIRDEQGDVRDYAEFVRHEKMDEATAENEGILSRDKGKRGFLIGRYASDNLYSLYRNDEITGGKAETIADIARGDESLEAAGIKAAKTMPVSQLGEYLKCLKVMPRVETEQGDLFGFDDSALQTAEKLSKLAAKHIREINEKLSAVKQAIKNPETAAKGDVKVGKNAQKIYDQTLRDKAEWEHWYTNPELSAKLREEAGLTEKDAGAVDAGSRNTGNTGNTIESAGDEGAQREAKDAETGRFNMDSETPLLSNEEDANDFQLTAESPAEAEARDRAADREKEAKRERADKEAERENPELAFGNETVGNDTGSENAGSRNTGNTGNTGNTEKERGEQTDVREAGDADSRREEGKTSREEELRKVLRDVIRQEVDGHIKQQRLLRLAKQFGMTEKEIQEKCEGEVVALAREINASDLSDEEKYKKLIELYNSQPNFSKRTSTSVANQAYSTPVPMAWLLGKRIGLSGHSVYEPTAGTGMLTVAGDVSTTDVNEIDLIRKIILAKQGFHRLTGKDASKAVPNKKYERIIMNPPFNSADETEIDGYKFGKLDHIIAVRALSALAPDGKAAIIVGANTEKRDGAGRTNYQDYVFLSYLYDKFNVSDNLIVSGDLYKKQGAGYPVRVITVNGVRSDGSSAVSVPKNIEIVKDWDTLYSKLKGELRDEVSGERRSADAHAVPGAGEEGRSAKNQRGSSARDTGSVGTDRGDTADRSGSAGRSGEVNEQRPGRSGSVGADQSEGRQLPGSAGSESDQRGRLGDRAENLSRGTAESGNRAGDLDDGGGSGSAGGKSAVRTGGQSDESAVRSKRIQVGEKRGELNNTYLPASQSKDHMDVVVPRFMAESLENSLSNLSEKVGDVDEFVRSELGYDTAEELYGALSDVQIDGVARAINAIRAGDGFVLGDQTGIGKGRQCAAMIRWAQKNGVMPVFCTKDQNLFTDMYRDGKDIGNEFKPLIVASDEEKARITDADGKKIVGLPKNQAKAFGSMLEGKGEYDCVFIPYSQLSKEGKQRAFLRNLIGSQKCLLIMDEAHEASGDSARGRFFYGSGGILQSDVGVIYASATFAKRPDNMALYFRTNIRKAVDNIEGLQDILTRGGVPLQQLLSAGLAQDGQYVRRERDFTGVSFDTVTAEPHGQKGELSAKEDLIEKYDRVAYVLGRLVKHSNLVRSVLKKALKDQYAKANTREDTNIQTASFGSVTHNYIAQLLLASKCDIVVSEAEKAFKAGQKPVIALTNTMESIIRDHVKDNGLSAGDPMTMKYSAILEGALNRMYKYTEKTGKGVKVEHRFSPEDYGLEDAHEGMLRDIHDLDDIDLPISPIDYIKNELEKRGIRTGEITGRELAIDYSGETPTLAVRNSKAKDKNRNVNAFNSGKTDAIILNASGSTGLSLHSSVKFADQKQRHMIMAQPSLDIAVVQQMFGRVLRSGQVNSPVYTILASPLAAERRPMMVLSRKLQSLNANTTANNKGAVTLGLDFMNKYGDLVAKQYLDDNPSVAAALDLDLSDDEGGVPQDLMTKLTGKMAVLDDQTQSEILEDLTGRYTNMVDFLKKTGNYDLEITIHDDWDAKTLEESEIASGETEGSIFQQPVKMKKINIREQRNIRSAKDVKAEIQENLGDEVDLPNKLEKDFAKTAKAIENLEKTYEGEETDADFIAGRKDHLRRVLEDFKSFIISNYGRPLEITIGEESYPGVITGYRYSGKFSERSPIVASKLMIDVAVSDTIGKITIPFSRFRENSVSVSRSFSSFGELFTGEKRSLRAERYAITGNLLRGLEYAEAGKIVSYKTDSGGIETALLMPKNWEPEQLVRDPRNEIQTVKDAEAHLNENGTIRSNDGLSIVRSPYGSAWINVPKSKRKGGKYFLDKGLLAITGDFTSYGSVMRTRGLSDETLRKALKYILKMEDTHLRKSGGSGRQYSLKRKMSISEINDEFNRELEQQIDGKLKAGHIYQLGNPSDILLSTGIPNLPIELSASHLDLKSKSNNHPFALFEVKNLPNALQNPIAVFRYGDAGKAQNIIVEIKHGDKDFLVGLHLNQRKDGLTVNSIRGLFPKDFHEWLNWIQQGKALYLDKEKIQNMITQRQINPADVSYIDLDSVNNIIRNFKNPNGIQENFEEKSPDDGIKQAFGSGNTSLRQVAAGFRKIEFDPGTVNLDLGGGKFDEGTKYLAERGVKNLIFDPVNRNSEHNRAIFDAVKNGGVDTVTCNNVLNVIQEREARSNVILQAAKALKPGGTAYFTVYEGDGTGKGRQSQRDAWQENRKTSDYLDEIREHFSDVTIKNKVITAKGPITEGKLSAWSPDSSFKNPIWYSLKRHKQVNPIREAGPIRDEHEERINDFYETRGNAELNRRAERRIQGMGGFGEAIQMIRDGDFALGSDVSQRVMQLVLNSDEFKALDADARAEVSDLYIKLGTEAGRSLAARRLGVLDINDIKSIQAHVNAFMAKVDQKNRGNDLRQAILDEFGIDIDNLPAEIVKDPDKLDEILRRMMSERATLGDKLYEFWINAILSGPPTHMANMLGNVSNAAYELGVKRLAEAAINTVARRKDGATFGEFKEMFRAVNWRGAWDRARFAFKNEALSSSGKLDRVRAAIGGKWGRGVRFFGRLLRAADEFAKAVVQPMEATAMAYREGVNGGLKGNDLQDYIANQIKDPESNANAFGDKRARELTFQEDPVEVIKALINLRESGGLVGALLKYELPFLKTPSNILRQGIRKSPLGAVNLAWQTGKALLGKRKIDGQYVSLAAEQLLAWGAVAMIAGMDDDDDDMPFLTGTSPRYGSAEQKFKANKIPPYSIRIGENYYSYKRIEPLATGLALIADGLDAFKRAKRGEDGTKIMKGLLFGTMKQIVVEKSFLDSLGEINRIVEDPERSVARAGTNFLSSWMPNVVRQTVNMFDDNVRDNKSRARGAEWFEDQFRITTNRMGITKGAPKLDYFGREITKDSLADSGPLWQLMRIVPIQSVNPDDNMNRAERLMWQYNQDHPEEEYYPDVPAYYFRRDGKTLYMTGDDYQDFVRESGQLAMKQIDNAFRHGLLNERRPTKKDIDLIKKIFSRARKEVRDKMYKKGRYSE